MEACSLFKDGSPVFAADHVIASCFLIGHTVMSRIYFILVFCPERCDV